MTLKPIIILNMNSTKKQSFEYYLERILMLSKKLNRPIRAIDIANSFSYSRASVSIALKKLEQEGYIIYKDDHVELTPEGLETQGDSNNISDGISTTGANFVGKVLDVFVLLFSL